MIPYSLVFALLFVLAFSGTAYMLLRKAPLLVQIPEGSIANRETFFAFCMRIVRSVAGALSPRRIKTYALAHTAKTLNVFRELSLKTHRVVETMAHSAKQRSQEMEWEHRWFSTKEEKRKEDESDNEEDDQGNGTVRS